MNLTLEEQYILERWRQLPDYGTIEVEKIKGKLFEVKVVTKQRPVKLEFAEKKTSMV